LLSASASAIDARNDVIIKDSALKAGNLTFGGDVIISN